MDGLKCQLWAHLQHYFSSDNNLYLLISFKLSFHSGKTIFSHIVSGPFAFDESGANYMKSQETRLRVNGVSFSFSVLVKRTEKHYSHTFPTPESEMPLTFLIKKAACQKISIALLL